MNLKTREIAKLPANVAGLAKVGGDVPSVGLATKGAIS